jgi:hypothetical protein
MKNIAKLAILIFVCFIFLGFGCKKKETTDTTSTTDQATQEQTQTGILGLNNQDVLSSSLQNLQTAKNKLIYWDKNGQFVSLNVDFSSNLEINSLNSIYSFSSKLNNQYSKYFYFAVSFNNSGQSIRTLVHKEDYLKDLPSPPVAINANFWKQSWFDAFKITEEAGGKTFREKDPTNTKINLSLYRSSPNNYLYWFVKYTLANADNYFTAQIDANTGKLIDSSGSGMTDATQGTDQPQTDQLNSSGDTSTSTDTNTTNSTAR